MDSRKFGSAVISYALALSVSIMLAGCGDKGWQTIGKVERSKEVPLTVLCEQASSYVGKTVTIAIDTTGLRLRHCAYRAPQKVYGLISMAGAASTRPLGSRAAGGLVPAGKVTVAGMLGETGGAITSLLAGEPLPGGRQAARYVGCQ